ncbi:hypothetical protein OCF65_18710 [Bacillus toyonensis]|uniref:hypothetical protein n=1 Tax=Bacillus cereus group TaxID=86661 RepID=UPI0010BD51CE|nr:MULTISPECIES: hypothetical protein [Bacillus cereus group]MCU5582470.1 hypothetical protein [Bacillus toyonensis]TKH76848.1 hypothetical protein FC688_21985 [Bacillus cereus]
MNSYGKLFRKQGDKSIQLSLRSYNPEKERYFQVIKEARSEGLKQVIINSEIMTNILYTTLELDGVILKVNLSDNTDDDIKENVKVIISKLRSDKLIFFKLKEELEWAADSGSIDINSIEIYFSNKRYQIYSNGIINGDNLEVAFDKIIKPVLEKYFYGR